MSPPRRGCDDQNDLRGISPSVDERLEILRHPRRRAVIDYCMSRSDPSTHVDTVADEIVDASGQSGEAADREQVAAALHHKHLPLLAEYGVIEFDPRSGQLRYQADELVEQWLARIRSEASE